MALDFVKNTANYLTYGAGAFNAVLNGASKIAVSAVVWLDAVSTGSAFDNRILSVVIDGTLAGVVLSINATGANDVVRFRGRSSSGEAEEISDGATHIATGAWIQVGGLLNIGGDSINTVRAGVVNSTTAVTFANATFTPGTPTDVDRIGAATEVPVAFTGPLVDGQIAEVAVWVLGSGDADFTAGEWGALGKFFSPLLVRPQSLVFYKSFAARRTAPSDYISKLTGTITGTLAYANHPPIFAPKKKTLFFLQPSSVTIPIAVDVTSVGTARLVRSGNLNLIPKAAHAQTVQRSANLIIPKTTAAHVVTVIKQLVKIVTVSAIAVRTARLVRTGLLNVAVGTVGYRQGIDFRATDAFVTDPADHTSEIGTTANYPRTTPQGNVVGWELAPSGTRNRDAAVDARIAGMHFRTDGSPADYRFDLPSAGDYRVRVAVGDAAFAQNSKVELFDGVSSLGVVCDGATAAGEFFDAAGTLHTTAANWVTNNAAVVHTLATGTFRVRVGGATTPVNGSAIAHVYIEAVDGQTGHPVVASLQRQAALAMATRAVRVAIAGRLLAQIISVAAVRSARLVRQASLNVTASSVRLASIIATFAFGGVALAVSAVAAVTASLSLVFLRGSRRPFGHAGMIAARRARRKWKRRPRP